MLDEIKAGVAHVRSLLANKQGNGERFSHKLQKSLEGRYAHCWYPADAERGSASRALVWHGHGGGEGLDEDIRRACLEEADHKVDNVCDMLPVAFTLWIDPSCVAIRMGAGPGVYLSSPYMSLNSTISVVWGTMPLSTPSIAPPVPQAPELRVLASTPALDSSTWTSNNVSKSVSDLGYQHARFPSTASSVDSFVAVSRSSSMSSSGDESEQSSCPSLSSASSSHRGDHNDSDSELSIEDMVGNGCYGHFDIIDDEDDEENIGDVTITPHDELDVTIGQLPTPGDASSESWSNPWKLQQEQAAKKHASHVVVESSKINYTIHDGGNVGVLGGGVRLGGGASTVKSFTPRPQHQLQAMPMPAAPMPVKVQLAPMPLRPELYEQYGAPPPPYTAHPSYYHQQQQQQHMLQQPKHLQGLHATYPAYYPGLPGPAPFDMAQQQYLADMMMRPKRIRSRGRRSRGRGAGRAARRQAAAALKALGQDAEYDSTTTGTPSTMTGSSFYGDDGEDDEEEEEDTDQTSAFERKGHGLFHNETNNALGLVNLDRPSTPESKDKFDTSLEATPTAATAPINADAATLDLVRQRAEQVASDLVRRQDAEREERVRLAKAKFQAQAAHAHAQLTLLRHESRRTQPQLQIPLQDQYPAPQQHGLQPYSYAAAAAH